MLYKKSAALFFILALNLYYQRVYACSCGKMSVEEGFLTSDAVFVGEVTDVQKNVGRLRRWLDGAYRRLAGKAPDDSVYLMTITFSVRKEWKGSASMHVTIQTPDPKECCICGFNFEVGKSYLVYASMAGWMSNPSLYTSICSRTKPLAQASAEILWLDRRAATAPENTTAE